MWTTPETAHWEEKETLGNTNQNKTTRTVWKGYNVYEKHPQRKHSELKEPEEMLHKTKTLTAIARQKKAKEKALTGKNKNNNEPVKLERSPTETLWKEQSLQDAKRNNKTTMKKSSDRRRPS